MDHFQDCMKKKSLCQKLNISKKSDYTHKSVLSTPFQPCIQLFQLFIETTKKKWNIVKMGGFVSVLATAQGLNFIKLGSK